MTRTVTLTFDDGSTHVYNGVPAEVTPEQMIARAQQDFPDRTITNIDGGRKQQPATDEDPELARHRNRAAVAEQQRTPTQTDGKRAARVAAIDARIEALREEQAQYQESDAPELGRFHPRSAEINAEIGELQAERNRKTPGEGGRTIGGAVGGVAGGFLGAPLGPVGIAAGSAAGGWIGSSIGAQWDRNQVIDLTPEEIEQLTREQWIEDAIIEGAFAFVPWVGGKVGRVALSTPAGRKLVGQIARTKGKPITDVAKLPDEATERVRRIADRMLKADPGADPAAVQRAAEFEALGIKPMQGQVTREPTQYTREKNLRGAPGGEDLANRFAEQDAALRGHLDELAEGAKEGHEAGGDIMQSLRTADDAERAQIDDAYRAARDSTGRAAPVDHVGFLHEAMTKLDEQMLTPSLPREIRNQLRMISDGRVPLNVETMVILQRRLAEAQRANVSNPSAQKAIGVVMDALNGAKIADSAGQEAKAAFDTARGMYLERAKRIEAVPGLRAAVQNEAPDKFVQTYILGSNQGEVTQIMRLLESDPAALNQARAQVADHLRARAFGADTAGDKAFASATFSNELKKIGDAKLRAIFGDEAADTFKLIDRVAAYIHQHPAGSSVNNSNTAAAIAVLQQIERIPGLGGIVGGTVGVLKKGLQAATERRFGREALAAKLPAGELQKEVDKLNRYLYGATIPARAGVRAAVGGEEEFAE